MEDLTNWRAPAWPGTEKFDGRYAKLELLSLAHSQELFEANQEDDRIWEYLPIGPFSDFDSYQAWVRSAIGKPDPRLYAIFDKDAGHWGGVASYLRIKPTEGSIEVGFITFSKRLQKTRAATEAIYLMMRWAFQAGYRRFEWKCNAANIPSRRAAERFGLSYEGVFRQATISKNRNRDTAWFAAIDKEWPEIEAAFEKWLAPENFTPSGQQKAQLRDLTRSILVTKDPATDTH